MRDLIANWSSLLYDFRKQGMQITDINPISALADVICDQLYLGSINRDDIKASLVNMGGELWQQQSQHLQLQAGIVQPFSVSNFPDFKNIDLSKIDLSKPLYRIVFTAHPVFALNYDVSMALCSQAEGGKIKQPKDAYAARNSITLQDEHNEAMKAVHNARSAISALNYEILYDRQKNNFRDWRNTIPQILGVATWVGYDLDGRSDISWADSFQLRLAEKSQAIEIYVAALQAANIPSTDCIKKRLKTELKHCYNDIKRFALISENSNDFAITVNTLTERQNKLVSSHAIATELHMIAKELKTPEDAIALMVIASDIHTHGFGMAEVHLRINAVQLRNAMQSVDGHSITTNEGMESTRSVIENLSDRIENEEAWKINFKSLDDEAATARRQLMLAAQFLKHIDCDQPIRLLIAECERPLTLMSALYLAHKMNISDKLDISPLFETSYGLEHGEQVIDQLLVHKAFINYVKKRGFLAIQTGFSDAGRFIGQIAANMAIERLQIKIAKCLRHRAGKDVALLIFNTHGESLGRGCAQASMCERQNFIMTPFARHKIKEMGIHIYHQSSFQGGDGYRLFGTPALARATMNELLLAETAPISKSWIDDPFYNLTGFSLDLFLALKSWHEALFNDPNYSDLLDVFGSNLLPKTGSRPTKRIVQAGNERRDPSKRRAIPHNAILQQLGFLTNVISGMGSAAQLDTEKFVDLYQTSPRLQQCLGHIRNAKALGSLNTVLAYCRLSDAEFWVNRAYHGQQHTNQGAFRKLGQHLHESGQAKGVRQTIWRLRDDLVDLYRLVDQIGDSSLRNTGKDRSRLDLLHAIRIAVIVDSLVLLCRTPSFAESNNYSNSDLLLVGLRLDFETAVSIIQSAFATTSNSRVTNAISETETYSMSNSGNYAVIEEQILKPLKINHCIILTITQMVSGHYGAHG